MDEKTKELLEDVERDVDAMAFYWMLRKFQYLERVSREFSVIVQPRVLYSDSPARADIVRMNLAMTEWFLFERPYERGRTPLQLFVSRKPKGTPPERLDRLRQVARTQFFSRFSICDKDPATDVCVLRDTVTDRRYDVCDQHICEVERWCDGVIALRIARVDGIWQNVGGMYLYDVAPHAETAPDGPGAVHPEDADLAGFWHQAGLYLRLIRDLLGADGRYADTVRFRKGFVPTESPADE